MSGGGEGGGVGVTRSLGLLWWDVGVRKGGWICVYGVRRERRTEGGEDVG